MSNEHNPYAPAGHQDYGQTAPPDYGQPGQPAYGQPTQQGYGQQTGQYGMPAAPQYSQHQDAYAPSYGQGPYGGPGLNRPALAGWFQRVGASLIDGVVGAVVPSILYGIAAGTAQPTVDAFGTPTTEPTGLGLLLMFVGLILQIGIWFWNRVWRQGKTGQSLGKSALGIRLAKEGTGQPAGVGLTLGREFAHILDGFLYLGYLWPLWDEKKQTFADKICGTLVVRG